MDIIHGIVDFFGIMVLTAVGAILFIFILTIVIVTIDELRKKYY